MPSQRKLSARANLVQLPLPSHQNITEVCDTVTALAWVTEGDIDPSSDSEHTPEPFSKYTIELTKEVQHNFQQIQKGSVATSAEVASREVFLSTAKSVLKKKTLILDLDDTLIHTINPNFNYATLQITHSNPKTLLYQDLTTSDVYSISVVIRPYAIQLLRDLSEIYEIVIFTAAQRSYANAILNMLDPHGKYISQRLFRDSCVYKNGVYLKDLGIFRNRELSDMVIVDNSITSFARHLSNGVYVPSYFGQNGDSTLLRLIQFLSSLSDAKDIPTELEKRLGIVRLYNSYTGRVKGAPALCV